ncbi:MAG: hypothetical protein RLZZ292_3709 [Bacteroidota bacterium]|jgi:hypothetical protein
MTAVATKLNPVQLHLLQMFGHLKQENHLEDFKKILADFYAKKVDELSDQLWEEKGLSDDDMDGLLNAHLRKKVG